MMSRKARALSVSASLWQGISPRIILQKRQFLAKLDAAIVPEQAETQRVRRWMTSSSLPGGIWAAAQARRACGRLGCRIALWH